MNQLNRLTFFVTAMSAMFSVGVPSRAQAQAADNLSPVVPEQPTHPGPTAPPSLPLAPGVPPTPGGAIVYPGQTGPAVPPGGWYMPPGTVPPWYYLPPAQIEPPPPKKYWYGWQSMIGVLLGDSMTVASMLQHDPRWFYAALATRTVSGPIVHMARGHIGRGFLSLGLNAVLPGVGMILVSTADDMFPGFLGLNLLVIGYFAGPIVDLTLLSTEPLKPQGSRAKGSEQLWPSSITVMPMVDAQHRGLSLVGRL